MSQLDYVETSKLRRAETEPEPEPVPAGPRSWKVAAYVRGESGPSYNGCRYKTEADAKAAGSDLFSRWMPMTKFEVEPSDDEPNR